jgi:hypothetical protein
MLPQFTLSPAENDFIYHFRRESHDLALGPAHQWLRDHGVCPSVMIPLLYHDQETNPRWLDRLDEDPIPAFQSPWSSREEFEARVWEALEAYPKLKEQPYVIPGYQVDPLRSLTTTRDQAHAAGRLEPDVVQAAMSGFRTSHPTREG